MGADAMEVLGRLRRGSHRRKAAEENNGRTTDKT
jgi:hypothetical protein